MVAINKNVPGWLLLLITVSFTVPLYWRRSHPFTVMVATAVPAFANSLSGAVLQAETLQLIVVYNIAYRLPFRSFWWVGALIAAPQTAGAVRFPDSAWWDRGAQFLWATLFVALMGVVVRSRRDYTRALVERARQLETERDQQTRLAAAAERARIAREMHDIIGHNLSVITGLADGGAYASRKSPERAGQALEGIATTSRQALGELRRLLDVLREEAPGAREPDLSPQCGSRGPRRAGGAGTCRRSSRPYDGARHSGRRASRAPAHGVPAAPGGAHEHDETRRAGRHRGDPGPVRTGRGPSGGDGQGRLGRTVPRSRRIRCPWMATSHALTRGAGSPVCVNARPCTAAHLTRVRSPTAGAGRSAGGSMPFFPSPRKPRRDHRSHRRRPAPAAARLPHAPGESGRPDGRGRGDERHGGRPSDRATPPRCGPDGHQDAGPGRHRGHPPDRRYGRPHPGPHPDHVRPGRVRVRGSPGRRAGSSSRTPFPRSCCPVYARWRRATRWSPRA